MADAEPRVAAVLDAARQELERAADDLERLTQHLRERTARVERLEALADALLELVPVGAVLIDPDGRIVAVSRRAVAVIPRLADGLGVPAAELLPEATLEDSRAKGVTLPDGSLLVELDG